MRHCCLAPSHLHNLPPALKCEPYQRPLLTFLPQNRLNCFESRLRFDESIWIFAIARPAPGKVPKRISGPLLKSHANQSRLHSKFVFGLIGRANRRSNPPQQLEPSANTSGSIPTSPIQFTRISHARCFDNAPFKLNNKILGKFLDNICATE